jgi:hypothetical protein
MIPFFRRKEYVGMNRVTNKIDINGIEVQLFEKMFNYVSNANFSNYPDEEVDAIAFPEDSAEACLPKVLVRKINLYEDVNFLLGKTPAKQKDEPDFEFPETIEIDSVEYRQCRIYTGEFWGRRN